MGKSTLIKRLCLDWSEQCLPQFDFVFLLDGKALTSTQPTFSLQTLLLNLSTFAPSCLDPDAVYAQITAAPKRVLILFDGFDDLRDYDSLLQTQEKDLVTSLQRDGKAQAYTVRQLYSAILQRVLLPGCTLLLSARPKGTASQLLRRTDSFLEVCGFSPTHIETYVSQYFADPSLRASALESLKCCSYLHFLCWNPGLCRLVCLVLEQCDRSEALSQTLTGLCHQVLHLKMKQVTALSQDEPQTDVTVKSVEPHIQSSSDAQVTKCRKNKWRMLRSQACTERGTNSNSEMKRNDSTEVGKAEERELLSQLSSLAWYGVKTSTSMLSRRQTLSAKLKAFGLGAGLFSSYDLRTRHVVSREETKENKTDGEEMERGSTESQKGHDDHILSWASPFLQSYLAAVHLSLSR